MSPYKIGFILFNVSSRRQFAKVLQYIQNNEQRSFLFQNGVLIGYKTTNDNNEEEKIIKQEECNKIAKKLGLSYLEVNLSLSEEDIKRIIQVTRAIFIINNNTNGNDSLLDSKQLDDLNNQLLMSIKKNQLEIKSEENQIRENQKEYHHSLGISAQFLSQSHDNLNKDVVSSGGEFQHLSHLQVSQTIPIQQHSQSQIQKSPSNDSPSQLTEEKHMASTTYGDKKVKFSAVLENLSNKNETKEIPVESNNTTENMTPQEIKFQNEEIKQQEEKQDESKSPINSLQNMLPNCTSSDVQMKQTRENFVEQNPEYLFQEKKPAEPEVQVIQQIDDLVDKQQSFQQKDLTLTQQNILDIESKMMLKQTFNNEETKTSPMDKQNIIQYLRTQLFTSHLRGSQLLSNNATSQFQMNNTSLIQTQYTSQQLKYHQNIALKIKINLTMQSGLQKIGFINFQLNDNVAKRTAEFCSQYDITDKKDYISLCELVKSIAIKHGYYTEAYKEETFASKEDRKPVGCVAQLRIHYGLANRVYNIIKGDERNLANQICEEFHLDKDLYINLMLETITACQQ